MKMKGDQKVTNTIGIVLIIGGMLFFIYAILPLIFQIYKESILSSSDIVSRQLAGFISISLAAPADITITYSPHEKIRYDVDVKERVVDVHISKGQQSGTRELSKILLDLEKQFSDVNIFMITKTRIKNENRVNVDAR